MKFRLMFVTCIILTTVLSACGGDGGGDKPIILQPDPIPAEYQGLSLDELKNISPGLSYEDILGDKEKGIYKNDTDPAITESILSHKGKLVYFEGMIEEIYPSSQEGIYTFWLCTDGWDRIRTDGVALPQCADPLFVLYSLDLGPELEQLDVVKLAATVYGSRIKKSRGVHTTEQAPYTTPEVSAIKLQLMNN